MNYLRRKLSLAEKRALQELMIDVELFLEGHLSKDDLQVAYDKYTKGKDAPLNNLEWDLEVLNG